MDQSASRQLPRETLPKTSWFRVAVIIPSTLVLLIVVNFLTLGYLDRYSTNYGYWTLHQKWNLLGKLEAPVDWLILGDSSCSQGAMPSIFESELGQSAINLCTMGDMGTLGDLWMLEEYVQRFGTPKNVLVIHTYDIWYRVFNPWRLGQIPRPFYFWESHTFGSYLVNKAEVRNGIFVEHYLPLYSQNNTLGKMIRATLAGTLNPLRPSWKAGADGFVPATVPQPDVVLSGAQQQYDFVAKNTFKVSELNNQALLKMVEMADSLHFNLFLANAPTYEGLFTNKLYQAYYFEMQTYLKDTVSSSQYAIYLSDVKTFPTDQMQNPDHLIISGAEEYTRWILGEINNSGR